MLLHEYIYIYIYIYIHLFFLNLQTCQIYYILFLFSDESGESTLFPPGTSVIARKSYEFFSEQMNFESMDDLLLLGAKYEYLYKYIYLVHYIYKLIPHVTLWKIIMCSLPSYITKACHLQSKNQRF